MSVDSQTQAALSNRARARTDTAARRVRSINLPPKLVDIGFLVVLIAGASAIYSVYALRIGSFQPDEGYYMNLAHFISNSFPSGLWENGIYLRGIQRVDQLILALPFAVSRGASVFEFAHIIQALLYASTAIPVWLLSSQAGHKRWASATAAVLVLVTPWAIVSTSFLAESAAYPAYAWVVYAVWRVMRRPSVLSEILAVLALAVAVLSRTALLAMAPLLPLAVLWQAWRCELRGQPWQRRLASVPAHLWVRHRILSVIVLGAIVVILASVAGVLPDGGVAALAGRYGLPHLEAAKSILDRDREYLSRMVVGTGLIAFMLGLAWTLRQLIWPSGADRHALALLCLLGVAVILASLLEAGSDERYILYGAIPITLAFISELQDRTMDRASPRVRSGHGLTAAGDASGVESMSEVSAAESVNVRQQDGHVHRARERIYRIICVAVGAAATILLIGSATWPTLASEYDFFTYPSAVFYRRAMLEHLANLGLPFVHSSISGLVEAVIAVAALLWAVTAHRRRAGRVATILAVACVLGVCVTELAYSLEKFTRTAAAISDGTNADERSWLASKVPAGAKVAAVGVGLGETIDYIPIWRTAEFWNPEIETGVSFNPYGIPLLPYGGTVLRLVVAGDGGRLRAIAGSSNGDHSVAVPRYLLLPAQETNPYGFVGQVIGEAPYLPLELVRIAEPARLEWSVAGTSSEGFMIPGQPAAVTVYHGALRGGRRCVSFDLVGPPAYAGRWPYTVSSRGHVEARGLLAQQQTRRVVVPLGRARRPSAGKASTSLISVKGEVAYPNGSMVSARIAGVKLVRCQS